MKFSSRSGRIALAVLAVAVAVVSGCAVGPETQYGVSRGTSLNGTSIFAAMIRDRGHQTRAAIRLTDGLASWADGIVRFAPGPGPPEKDEADWYRGWLAGDRDRWLIYVVCDFDAESEYWKEVRDQYTEAAQTERRNEAEEKRSESSDWVSRLPRKAEQPADPQQWFETGPAVTPPAVCTKLEGAWAEGIDAEAAALSLHEPLKIDSRCVLLAGDGKPLAADKSLVGGPRILVIASGSFLLNEALVNTARRPLAERVADWPESKSGQVAFVEGFFVLAGDETQSIWKLFSRLPAPAVGGHPARLGRIVRGARACAAPGPAAARPGLGGGSAGGPCRGAGDAARAPGAGDEARELLDRYRLWRHPQTSRELSRVSARIRPRAQHAESPAAAIAAPSGPVAPTFPAGTDPGRDTD